MPSISRSSARRSGRRLRPHPPRRAARDRGHRLRQRRRLGREPDRARRAWRRSARADRLVDAVESTRCGSAVARRRAGGRGCRVKIAIVTDAWSPQRNGVVTTLVDLTRWLARAGHGIVVVEPSAFRRVRCPGYAEIELAWRPGAELARRLDDAAPDAIHIATEGPLGLAARAWCLRRRLPFTTAFHSRFPEFLETAFGVPARWGYAAMRRFHAPSSYTHLRAHETDSYLVCRL